MNDQTPNLKTELLNLLQTLASENEQLEYEKNVPCVDITSELVCMWFDDLYHPQSERLKAQFTGEQWAALEEFNSFYAAQKQSLPESQSTVRTWLADPTWRSIMQKAAQTLARIKN